ncbi:hypothetical protein SteCoe_18072 [Stentor coeruleus]|uniref:Importin N-terminal domain-containing protein n=1 Tax=Stentor coeruleus TaxID=5963 RepID=A0A1R2BXV8_9CILI|nr:hypothetical protein SteCoe_18072 [Stentor coeruleus]
MDENILLSAFSASLGADNNARSKAHEYLQSIRSAAGLIPLLLKVSLDSANSLELRQVAVIYLKNLTKGTKDSNKDFIVPEIDKEFLKFHILTGLSFSIPEKLRSQYEEIAHNIAKTYFPWEQILTQISQALDNPNSIYSGLNMIYQVSRNYEYTMNDKRTDLISLVELFFDKILTILKELIISSNPDKYSYIQLILQTYWVSFYISIPLKLSQKEILEHWLQGFYQILSADYGEIQAKSLNEEEDKLREKSPQWMCKKWAGQIVHRFFTRYFNLNHIQEQNLFIGQYFQSVWAVEFFKIIIPQLFQTKDLFIPSVVLNYYIKYVIQGIKFTATFELLDEVAVSNLLVNVIMPVLCRVASDEEIWKENPIEFIRKEADMGRAYYSPKSSAIDLLLILCEKGFINKFFEYIAREIQLPDDLLRKEALMLAFGSISEQVKKNNVLKDFVERILTGFVFVDFTNQIGDFVERILTGFVFVDFTNQIGFLRARAAWVCSKYAGIDYENLEFKTSTLESICRILKDSELPVRYEAALALPKLIGWNVTKQRLATEVKNLLEIYLKLMGDIDSEDLVEALESIVSAFPKETLPFSLELTQHLASAFSRMVAKDMSEDEGESAMAAVSTLNTISKIIDILEDKPEDLIKVSLILKPVFEYCLSEKGCDYFEETLNLLTCLLYYSPEKSLPHLYYLIRQLRASILGEGSEKPYALEHINEIFSPIANFIKKYPEQTLENLNGIIDIGFALIKDKEEEAINGCKILIALMENFKGHIDNFLILIIKEISIAFLQHSSKKVKNSCSQAMFVALWNNPILSLSSIDILSPAIQYALSSVKSFNESLARSHMIYGLGSLFYIIPSLPLDFQGKLPMIFKCIIQLYEDNDDDSSAEGIEFDDEGNGPGKIDAHCQKIIDKIRNSANDEDDDEDDFPFGDDSEDLYDSPFEALNQNDMIKDVTNMIKGNFPELLQNIVGILSENEIKILNSIIQ